MENIFSKIIKEICDEKEINFTLLSNDWIIKLQKNNKIRFIVGYKFGINSHSVGLIFDDKYATYNVLKSLDIPVIEHKIYYSSSNNNDYALKYNSYDYLKKIFEQFNNDIVLKINSGSLGTGVYHIKDYKTLYDKFLSYNSSKSSFSICPFYDIKNEYRAIVLDNKIQLLYKKIKPVIVGDGKSTIKELLMKFNKNYYSDYNKDNKNEILENGKIYEENWQFNLSRGAISSLDIKEEDKNQIFNIVNRIINNIDVGFCSIDIIKTINNEFYVMEINSGVMMNAFMIQNDNGYMIAKRIYSLAIDELFKKKANL